jgi:hypothetical protein
MKEFNDFKEKCNKISENIREIDSETIIDGVINIEKYFNLPKDKPKILWVLKEANSNDKSWDYQDLLSTQRLKETRNYSIISIRRVIYSSYGILNDFKTIQESPHISDENVYSTAEQIAYININKRTGGSVSVDAKLFEAYAIFRDIILEQIKVYNPDIIIFGNTMKYIFEDLKLNVNDKLYVNNDTYNTAYYTTDKQLYIYPWHPSKPNKGGDAVYCNEIIEIAKKWWLNKK